MELDNFVKIISRNKTNFKVLLKWKLMALEIFDILRLPKHDIILKIKYLIKLTAIEFLILKLIYEHMKYSPNKKIQCRVRP